MVLELRSNQIAWFFPFVFIICMTVCHYVWNLQEMFWSLIGFEILCGCPMKWSFFYLVKLFCYLQTGRAQFWQEIHFYSYLGIKDHKIGSFVFYHLKILVTFLTFYHNSKNLAKLEIPKWFWPSRLQDFWKCNIWRTSQNHS